MKGKFSLQLQSTDLLCMILKIQGHKHQLILARIPLTESWISITCNHVLYTFYQFNVYVLSLFFTFRTTLNLFSKNTINCL